jgi:hypothetical protein
VLSLSSAVANVSELPPLNNETIVGVWEGLLQYPPAPITLFRMQIRSSGGSYLVQITPQTIVGRPPNYIVYKLVRDDSKVTVGETATLNSTENGVTLEMTGTPINLHFQQVSPGPGIHDFWIKGIGTASPHQDFGLIHCTNLGKGIWFVKGKWTEDLGKASEKADDAIKQLSK